MYMLLYPTRNISLCIFSLHVHALYNVMLIVHCIYIIIVIIHLYMPFMVMFTCTVHVNFVACLSKLVIML